MKKTVIAIALVTSFLTACGASEPSEKELIAAIEKQLQSKVKDSSGAFSAEDIIVRHIKKLGCSEADGQNGYMCEVDVDIDVKLPFVGTQTQKGVQSLRFIESDEGWRLVQ